MSRTERKITPLPLYFKVMMDIQEKILSGEWERGAHIPGEIDLARELGVSVITVRQALGQLVREGYIHRARAKGSFVSWDVPRRQSVSFDVEVDSLVTLPPGARFKLLHLEVIKAHDEQTKKIGSGKDEKVMRIVRVRMLNETPLEYVISHIPMRVGALIPEHELSRLPIPHAVETFSGIDIVEVKHTVGAVLSDAEVSLHLEIPTGSPVLLIERDYFSKKEITAVSVAYYRSDLFRYALTLKRRMNR